MRNDVPLEFSLSSFLPSRSSAPPTPLYGPPTAAPPASVARKLTSTTAGEQWQSAPFFYIQTELSPATLYHSTGKSISLFANLKEAGLGAPTLLALPTSAGPRILRPGQPIDPAAMSECWLLVWFANAPGWTDWDSPWLAFLQHKPAAIKLDDACLALDFSAAAGDIVLLPLYGYYKPPQADKTAMTTKPSPATIQTATWDKGLPADVLARIRYWSRVLREFPIYCEDSFSVDRAKDTVTIRQRFEWRSIDDDWKTPHLKLAPLSPPLALAAQDPKFPVRFSAKVTDPEMFTPYGPYVGVEGVDSFDSVFAVLPICQRNRSLRSAQPRRPPHGEARPRQAPPDRQGQVPQA